MTQKERIGEMLVKNIGTKAIGFGSILFLPDETKELPKGYDENHPVVKFYVEKGLLIPKVEADKIDAEKAASEKAVAEKAEADRIAAEEKAKELAKKIKALASMKPEELRTIATELGIEFIDTDTKDVLKKKITEKYQAE